MTRRENTPTKVQENCVQYRARTCGGRYRPSGTWWHFKRIFLPWSSKAWNAPGEKNGERDWNACVVPKVAVGLAD